MQFKAEIHVRMIDSSSQHIRNNTVLISVFALNMANVLIGLRKEDAKSKPRFEHFIKRTYNAFVFYFSKLKYCCNVQYDCQSIGN